MRRTLLALLALCFAACSHVGHDPKCPPAWNYETQQQWPAEWPACGAGPRSSPINIVSTTDASDPRIAIAWKAFTPSILDNKRGVKFYANDGGKIIVTRNGVEEEFTLYEMHFHVKGEHTFGSPDARAPMELHLVHKNSAGEQKVVITILFDETNQTNEGLAQVLSMIKQPQCEYQIGASTINPMLLLPENWQRSAYYEYEGSLTTPECNGELTFFIFQTRTQTSDTQVGRIASFIAPNAKLVGVRSVEGVKLVRP